jgi:hypothetical protein
MTISLSKCSNGGKPCRSCSRKLLPRWRSVSHSRIERCAKSTAYCAALVDASQGDIGFGIDCATSCLVLACRTRSPKRSSATFVRVCTICATFADTSRLWESRLVGFLLMVLYLSSVLWGVGRPLGGIPNWLATSSSSSWLDANSRCQPVTTFSRRPVMAAQLASLRNFNTYVRRLG